MSEARASDRLEYLRGELRAERISMSELVELQCLADQIDPGDVELLEAAGVPEGACPCGATIYGEPATVSQCGCSQVTP